MSGASDSPREGDPELADVSALVFDLYGTLLDVTSLAGRCREVAGEERSGEFLTLWRQKQLEYSWLRALMGHYADFWVVTGEALENAAARLGIRLERAQRAALMDGWLRLRAYPEVPDALARLATCPLAILSNGSPAMLESVLEESGLRSFFAHVLSVDEVRTYKPSPAVYQLAERHLGLKRAEILFVSANGWDVAGAAAFGLRVAWINRAGAPREQLPGDPQAVVSDLARLAELAGAQRPGEASTT